ncbi:hypothetical protein AFLA_009614 [Aspergillus flavus NRRL3357]|nr:hypothetical protein AFLA_009614 [Aspergillus flavus NRRL3357]
MKPPYICTCRVLCRSSGIPQCILGRWTHADIRGVQSVGILLALIGSGRWADKWRYGDHLNYQAFLQFSGCTRKSFPSINLLNSSRLCLNNSQTHDYLILILLGFLHLSNILPE